MIDEPVLATTHSTRKPIDSGVAWVERTRRNLASRGFVGTLRHSTICSLSFPVSTLTVLLLLSLPHTIRILSFECEDPLKTQTWRRKMVGQCDPRYGFRPSAQGVLFISPIHIIITYHCLSCQRRVTSCSSTSAQICGSKTPLRYESQTNMVQDSESDLWLSNLASFNIGACVALFDSVTTSFTLSYPLS